MIVFHLYLFNLWEGDACFNSNSSNILERRKCNLTTTFRIKPISISHTNNYNIVLCLIRWLISGRLSSEGLFACKNWSGFYLEWDREFHKDVNFQITVQVS